MKSKPTYPQLGFTLLETVIAATLLSGMSLLVAYTLLGINSGTSVIVQSQSAKAQIRIAYDYIAQHVFNTIRLSPVEDLFTATPRDLKYKGIYGFAQGEAYPWTSCRLEPGKFSLVRLTTILPRTQTEATLRLWRENQATTTQLRITRTTEAQNQLSGVPNGPPTVDSLGRQIIPLQSDITEVLIIDGDSLAQRRYQITDLKKIITTRDPNSDLAPLPGTASAPTFIYTELALKQTDLLGEGRPRAEISTFISGSTVYAVKTSAICVQGNQVVEMIENPAPGIPTSKVLFDSTSSQLILARFQVTYGSSRASSQAISFSEFPSSVSGANGIGCVNVVNLLLELRPPAGALTSNIVLQKQILLGNHNENRPSVCL